MDVANEPLFVRVGRLREKHQRGRIGRDGPGDVARHGQPHDRVILRRRIADPRHVRGRCVILPHEPLLRRGEQAGDRSAWHAGWRGVVPHRAGHLENVSQQRSRMIHDRLQAPDVPSPPAFRQDRGRDGNVLGLRRRAAGQREHEHPLARRQQCIDPPGAHLLHIWRKLFIGTDGDASAKLIVGLSRIQSMIAAELREGAAPDQPVQKTLLTANRRAKLGHELSRRAGGLQAGSLGEDRIENRPVGHAPGDSLMRGLRDAPKNRGA